MDWPKVSNSYLTNIYTVYIYIGILCRYELAKVEVERGKFLLAEDDLIKQEQQLAKEKTDMALQRLRKEEMKAKRAIRQHAKRQKYD